MAMVGAENHKVIMDASLFGIHIPGNVEFVARFNA
jgi:hypothetical protein